MHIVIELTKYLMLIMVTTYTYHAFRASGERNKNALAKSFRWMTLFLFLLHFTGYFTMYIQLQNDKLLLLYGAQLVLFALVIAFYKIIYPGISGLIIRNMLMLLSIGYIILTRLSFDKAVRQFIISGLALGIGLLVPMVMKSFAYIRNYGWIYGIVGIVLLVLVLIVGTEKYGATSWLSVFGLFSIQPTEFVKLLFVFCIASLFAERTDFKIVCAVTAMAAVTVLAVVFQKDLGGALIFFVTYIFMLYGASGKPLYLFTGLVGGSVASWVAYRLFDHVKVRVMAWKNPLGYIDKEGYQISQSLFAIGTGGWFGMGLYQGLPTTIPVVDSDFVFSAISEEFGGLFAICLILIYVNCFLVLINVSIKTTDNFYRLLSLGFAVMFGFQTFLSIGGVIKFIPSTGVTLPFISSGGSSIVAMVIMFMIAQGIHNEGNTSNTRKVDISSTNETHED